MSDDDLDDPRSHLAVHGGGEELGRRRCSIGERLWRSGKKSLQKRLRLTAIVLVLRLSLDFGVQRQVLLTAAPPAMVPSRQLLISITFFTVWLAIQFPAVALESVATMMPPLNRKASVVVPWAILMGQLGFE